MTSFDPPPEISIIIPVYNEAESIYRLALEIREALAPCSTSYEAIFVDDGSIDGTWDAILAVSGEIPQVWGIRLRRNFGQTAAMTAGIDRSRGRIVVTMDGDLQNDPADIPRLLSKLEEGYDIVSGWRRHRHDRLVTRRIPSRLANAIIRRVTGVKIHDQGCSLKAYRGEILRNSSLYSEFHRFVVPFTQVGGARVAEVETNHRPRIFGRSKYGLDRALKVVADLTTLVMVLRFGDRVLLWFLLFAIPPMIAVASILPWIIHAIAAPTGTGMLIPVGVFVLLAQSILAVVSYGLIAERVRHLTPARRGRSRQSIATWIDAGSGKSQSVLILGGGIRPIGGGAESISGSGRPGPPGGSPASRSDA